MAPGRPPGFVPHGRGYAGAGSGFVPHGRGYAGAGSGFAALRRGEFRSLWWEEKASGESVPGFARGAFAG